MTNYSYKDLIERDTRYDGYRYVFDVDKIKEIAAERKRGHEGTRTQRVWVENHEEVGLAGEAAFAHFCGLEPNWNDPRNTDKGIDFTPKFVWNGEIFTRTIDVKGSNTPGHLVVEPNKVFAQYYVLAGVTLEVGLAELIGYANYAEVLAAPIGKADDPLYKRFKHYIKGNTLTKMDVMEGYLLVED